MENKPESVFNKMIETDYFSQWMGVELVEVSEGYCKLRMKVRKEMLNGFGILHGGVSFSLADSAFAFACNSYGRLSVGINGNIRYVKPAHEGDVLIAEAKELALGHKTATFDVTVTNESTEETISLFRGTVYRTSREV